MPRWAAAWFMGASISTGTDIDILTVRRTWPAWCLGSFLVIERKIIFHNIRLLNEKTKDKKHFGHRADWLERAN
jgi:hypothetical protein